MPPGQGSPNVLGTAIGNGVSTAQNGISQGFNWLTNHVPFTHGNQNDINNFPHVPYAPPAGTPQYDEYGRITYDNSAPAQPNVSSLGLHPAIMDLLSSLYQFSVSAPNTPSVTPAPNNNGTSTSDTNNLPLNNGLSLLASLLYGGITPTGPATPAPAPAPTKPPDNPQQPKTDPAKPDNTAGAYLDHLDWSSIGDMFQHALNSFGGGGGVYNPYGGLFGGTPAVPYVGNHGVK